MTPGARIEAVIDLLEEVWAGDEPAAGITEAYFRKRRYAGTGDRRAIQESLYGVLRRRARLDWWIARTGAGVEFGPRTRIIAHMALAGNSSPQETAAVFSGAKHCPESLTGPEEALSKALYGRPLDHADMPTPVALEYPDWMDRSFSALWPDRLAAEMSALNQPPSVDLRVNTLKTTPEAALESLKANYLEAEPMPLSPMGIRIEGEARLGGTEAFKKGWIEVQDEGAQLIALLTGARPGMQAADFCAGGGGKVLALAASMAIGEKIEGGLWACDISAFRLERLAPRLQKAGAEAVNSKVVAALNDPWVTDNAGTFDRVLTDVPSTGTGTWRRDPDARWRFTPANLDDLLAVQQRILEMSQTLVKPGGRLIYSTHSLLQEENEQQLAWFLENHVDFQALPIDEVWAETVGGPPPPPGPALRLSPASTGTDGFFCAVLERKQ